MSFRLVGSICLLTIGTLSPLFGSCAMHRGIKYSDNIQPPIDLGRRKLIQRTFKANDIYVGGRLFAFVVEITKKTL